MRQWMTHKAATLVDSDLGEFTAVISTGTVDREKDIVLPGAVVDALQSWTTTGKMVPLHWSHGTGPEDIIGHIDPGSVEARGNEVIASGWVEQSTPRGAATWRLIKSGTIGFSYGFLVIDAVKRPDGVRVIKAMDVFEISATPAPMNASTRVISHKAVDFDDAEDLRRRCDEIEAKHGQIVVAAFAC
jgi:HK97 family phage prohead protease